MTVNAVKHAARTTKNASMMMWRHLHCQAESLVKAVQPQQQQIKQLGGMCVTLRFLLMRCRWMHSILSKPGRQLKTHSVRAAL